MNKNEQLAVEVRGLEKRFGDFTAVNKIDFSVGRGEIFGFLGPNGAGKSTTIRMLCGIITPTSGSGTVDGYDIIREQTLIKHNIGYMSQKFSLYDDLSVEENIDFYAGIYKIPKENRKERKEWIIRMAALEGSRSALTHTLSRGWKQRLALGCAIIHKPPIVFLDEPTSGVDPIARNYFWALIKDMARSGVTVFVTTHYMDEAENCGRVALIYRGSIVAMGDPEELKSRYMKEEVLEVSIANAQDWISKLEKIEAVKDVALFGASLHVIVYDARSAAASISAMLGRSGSGDFNIHKISPSLEDVFVSLVEAYDRGEQKR